MNKKIQLPLFWKFTIAIVFVVVLFGTINLYFINYALLDLSNKEINRHGISTAKVIVERSIDPILYNDIPYLNKIVSDNLEIDPSIAYIIITDKSNQILTHTFKNTVPTHLIDINKNNHNLRKITRISDKNDSRKIIRNMYALYLNKGLKFLCIYFSTGKRGPTTRIGCDLFFILPCLCGIFNMKGIKMGLSVNRLCYCGGTTLRPISVYFQPIEPAVSK